MISPFALVIARKVTRQRAACALRSAGIAPGPSSRTSAHSPFRTPPETSWPPAPAPPPDRYPAPCPPEGPVSSPALRKPPPDLPPPISPLVSPACPSRTLSILDLGLWILDWAPARVNCRPTVSTHLRSAALRCKSLVINRSSTFNTGGLLFDTPARRGIMPQVKPLDKSGELYLGPFGVLPLAVTPSTCLLSRRPGFLPGSGGHLHGLACRPLERHLSPS